MTALGDFTAGDVLTAADMNAIGTWSTYTPSLTASITNPSLGTGFSASGHYAQIQDIVHVMVFIVFGSGASAGNGDYRVSLPITPDTTNNAGSINGTIWLYDSSSAIGYGGIPSDANVAGYVTMYLEGTSTITVRHNNPFTWTASDQLRLFIRYKAA